MKRKWIVKIAFEGDVNAGWVPIWIGYGQSGAGLVVENKNYYIGDDCLRFMKREPK